MTTPDDIPPIDDSHPNPPEVGQTAGPKPADVADKPGAVKS